MITLTLVQHVIIVQDHCFLQQIGSTDEKIISSVRIGLKSLKNEVDLRT